MRIKIYQINQDLDDNRIKFCGLQEMQKLKRAKGQSELINPAIYDEVFSGEVDCSTLEDIYRAFNLEHPPSHRGHSLSVSDIVEISDSSDNNLNGFYYCDCFGFENIHFDPEQSNRPDNLLRVVMVEHDKLAYETELEDSLKALQRAVRGRLEVTCPFGPDVVLVSNAESKINELLPNRKIYGETYCGNFFAVGDDHAGNFCSLTDEQVQVYLERFKEPEFYESEELESGINLL